MVPQRIMRTSLPALTNNWICGTASRHTTYRPPNGPFWGYLLATIYSRSLGGDTGLGHSTSPLVAVTIGTLRLSSKLKLGWTKWKVAWKLWNMPNYGSWTLNLLREALNHGARDFFTPSTKDECCQRSYSLSSSFAPFPGRRPYSLRFKRFSLSFGANILPLTCWI